MEHTNLRPEQQHSSGALVCCPLSLAHETCSVAPPLPVLVGVGGPSA